MDFFWQKGLVAILLILGMEGCGGGGGGVSPVPPTITRQPEDATVPEGGYGVFRVEASGTGPLNFQWKQNGVAIKNMTNASLSIPNVDAYDQDSAISVEVSNPAGSVQSLPAHLRVITRYQERFRRVGDMFLPRTYHSATLLENGRVVIIGGQSSDIAYNNSIEEYDPILEKFFLVSIMPVGRALHGSTRLPSGKVLILGGIRLDDAPSRSCEIYDPILKKLTPAANMLFPRIGPVVTELLDGRVLVAGGGSESANKIVEIYDPKKGTWESGGDLLVDRTECTVTTLSSGKVLLAGGTRTNGYSLTTSEVYDPLTRTTGITGPFLTINGKINSKAAIMPGGNVLVAGGDPIGFRNSDSSLVGSAEVFYPETSAFSGVPPMLNYRKYHTMTVLDNWKILICGGIRQIPGNPNQTPKSEIFDPKRYSFFPSAIPVIPRQDHTSTKLLNGKVLITGGTSDSLQTLRTFHESAELFE